MKKFFLTLVCLSMVVLSGCRDEEPEKVAYKIGMTAGAAFELVTNDPAIKAVVIEVNNKALELSNKFLDNSASDVIVPIVTEIVQKYVDEKKITAEQSIIVIRGATIAAAGIDYVFKKHPDYRKDVDKILSVVKGFFMGMNTALESHKELLSANGPSDELDIEAFDYLKTIR